jgi:hypothetical protein
MREGTRRTIRALIELTSRLPEWSKSEDRCMAREASASRHTKAREDSAFSGQPTPLHRTDYQMA